MHLKTLRVFCDVVRRRSFSRAASDNGISQSAASQMVHHLEDRLGVKLIDRSKRPFVLTPEGSVYYEGCRGMVDQYRALEEQVRSLHEEVAGRVRVASIYSIGLHHMARYVQRFLGRYPQCNVRLEYLHPAKVYQSVERDVADLGLVSYPKSSRLIEAIPWREEPMLLVCSPAHPLAERPQVALEDLQGVTMINFDEGLSIRREIDRSLHQRGIEVVQAMEFDNIETIKRAIEIDLGVGLLPAPTVAGEAAAGTLCAVPLADEPLIRPIGIIHRKGRELCATAVRFVELLKSDAYPAGDGAEAALRTDHVTSEAAAKSGGGRSPAPESVAGVS